MAEHKRRGLRVSRGSALHCQALERPCQVMITVQSSLYARFFSTQTSHVCTTLELLQQSKYLTEAHRDSTFENTYGVKP